MNKKKIQKTLCKAASNLHHNSSTILTCLGAIGVVGTSVLSIKATPKALRLINDAEDEKGEHLTKFEVIKVAGKVYIPSILIGASTIACIFGANVLNKKNQAALSSAYALINNSYNEYKNKVKELYGDETDTKIRNSIAEDKFRERNFDNFGEETLFYDEYTDSFFESTMEKVVKAEYEINRDLALKGFVMLNEFYGYLDLPPVENGDALGWSLDAGDMLYGYSWIDFEHIKVEAEDGDDPDYCEFYRLVMKYPPTIDYDIITDPDKPTKWKTRKEGKNEEK